MPASKSPFSLWTNMVMQSTKLAIESNQVIAMRLTKMAMGGPDVQREAELMVSEKMAALAESSQILMMGALGGRHDMGAGKVMQHYRSKVRANRRRLGGA
jgi:thiamine pyrophosphokinase